VNHGKADISRIHRCQQSCTQCDSGEALSRCPPADAHIERHEPRLLAEIAPPMYMFFDTARPPFVRSAPDIPVVAWVVWVITVAPPMYTAPPTSSPPALSNAPVVIEVDVVVLCVARMPPMYAFLTMPMPPLVISAPVVVVVAWPVAPLPVRVQRAVSGRERGARR
jgi:hypothetical protein